MSSITTAYHPEIDEKLNFFLKTGKIPNIIFHGASGSGKRTIVNKFIANIYQNNKTLIKNYVMYVNCAHGKGIKFVRDELKFFAKTHVSVEGAGNFKTIVLSNADELTIDAQSALRRCIELFSHTTRFFIIVQDKYKLLKPILSRLCEIFIYEPTINGKKVNLHKHNIQSTFNVTETSDKKMYKWFDKMLQPLQQVQDQVQDHEKDTAKASIQDLMELANKLYEKGYSGLDLMKYIEQTKTTDDMKKYQMLLVFNKIKREFRNEKLFILFILNFLLLRSDYDLENISFM
jgi:DNA polymerase III delta prime subunit